MAKFLYPDIPKEELTQEQKDTITNIITLATASTAYAITDGNVANSVSAVEVGRVGVGNNDHDRLLPNGTSYHPGDRVRFSDEEALFIKDAIGFVVTPIGFLDAYHNAKTDEDKALAVATAFKIPIGKARTYVQKAKTKQNTRVGHEPDNDFLSSELIRLQNSIDKKIAQSQRKHILGDSQHKHGSYFKSERDAQDVLDAFHKGEAKVVGYNKQGQPIVKYEKGNGIYSTNTSSGEKFSSPTNYYLIKGTKKVSIVPYSPKGPRQ